MHISVVVPGCNESHTVAPLAQGIATHLDGQDWELLFIDDGSNDGTWEELRAVSAAQPRVRAYRFDKNRGKALALRAGFERAQGSIIVTMDGDLQDDPAELPHMLAKLDEGFGMVCGWKAHRHDPWHKTLPSAVYNGLLRRMFRMPLHDVNTGFKAMRAEVALQMPAFGGLYRLFPAFAQHHGYTVTEIPVRHHARKFDHSKFGPLRVFGGFRDALAVWTLLRRERAMQLPPSVWRMRASLVFLMALLLGLAAAGLYSNPTPDALRVIILLGTVTAMGIPFRILTYRIRLHAHALRRLIEHPPVEPGKCIVETAGE